MLKPVVANSDDFDPPADVNAAADFAEQGWQVRRGTVAQRAAVPSAEIAEGSYWRDTDGTAGLYERRGGAWAPMGPFRTEGKRRIMTSNNIFVDKLTFTDLPVAADAAAAAGTFTKVFATSKLILRVNATAQLNAGVSQIVIAGLSVNGVDYEVDRFLFPTGTRARLSNELVVTGVSAGTDLVVKPRIRTEAAAQLYLYGTGDSFSWTITEAP